MQKIRNYNIITILILFLVVNCGAPESQVRDRQEIKTLDSNKVKNENAKKTESNANSEPLVISSGEVETPSQQRDIEEDQGSSSKDDIEEEDAPPSQEMDQEEELEVEVDEPEEEEIVIVSSKGVNGLTGMNEVAFTASNNLSSTYKIMAPADAGQKVYGLHIHLHGDGGGGYQDFPNVETRFDLIGVTILSPNNGQSWNRDGQNFSQFLHELIQDDLLKKYDIDLSRIYFSSVSGGSYFLTGAFVPLYGQFYKSGGAFMMCGGRPPQFDFVQADTIRDFRLHWQSTLEVDRADIANSVNESILAYKLLLDSELGDPLTQSSVVEGAFGHCEFDGVAYTSGIQFMIDTNFSAILPEIPQ